MRRITMATVGFVTGLTGAAGAAGAQARATVAGRVTILEKDNKSSQDLSNAVIWIESQHRAAPAAPGTPAAPAAPAAHDSNPPRTLDIAIHDKIYAPRVVVAPVGSTVRFPNYDPFNHNVFSVSEGNSFDLGLFGRGETRGQTFVHAGLVRVFCNVHPRMVAYVVLVSSRFFTQPVADGSFTLADVPPGRYRLHAWHERVPAAVTQDIVVGPGAAPAPVQIQLDARKYRFVQHRNKLGKSYPTNAGRERY
jgi:plastocyanin